MYKPREREREKEREREREREIIEREGTELLHCALLVRVVPAGVYLL